MRTAVLNEKGCGQDRLEVAAGAVRGSTKFPGYKTVT